MPIETSRKPGLRERKKQQTRETIARVALELFAQRGYDDTTLADIADAADVSPRTIFAYYQSKEDILFCEEPAFLERLSQMLSERPPGTTTIDALREFLFSLDAPGEDDKLRKRIIAEDPALYTKMRARHAQLEPLLAESIAKDLGADADDVRPLMIAASMTAAFTAARDRFFDAESGGEPISHEQALQALDQVLDFLRGGFDGLQRE
jgi:AcrR family transcriptional regulator